MKPFKNEALTDFTLKKNKKDLIDLPKKVQREMKFVYVERMDEVLPIALTRAHGPNRANGRDAAPRPAARS